LKGGLGLGVDCKRRARRAPSGELQISFPRTEVRRRAWTAERRAGAGLSPATLTRRT